VKPKPNLRLSIAHWGNSHITGRGLLALAGNGQIYQVNVDANEEYIVHPQNVVAYSVGQYAPQPYRFRSTSLRFQIPSLSALLPDTRLFNELRKSTLWKELAQALFTFRTWARRSIWGDRLFLQFRGPTTILVQSRGSRLIDSLSSDDVNEVADTPAGTVKEAVKIDSRPGAKVAHSNPTAPPKPLESMTKVRYATIGPNHAVTIK